MARRRRRRINAAGRGPAAAVNSLARTATDRKRLGLVPNGGAPSVSPRQMLASQGPRITSGPNGRLVVQHEELFMTPTVQASGDAVAVKAFCPGISGMKLLDNIAKGYDKYRVRSVVLKWKTSVGTTVSGAVLLAVDGNPATKGTSLAYVQALCPKFRGPVWSEGQVVPQISDLMSQRWLNTSTEATKATNVDYACFAAVLAITGAQANVSYGEVWCHYVLDFAFPSGN